MTARKLVRAWNARPGDGCGWLGCGHYARVGDLVVKVRGQPTVCGECRLAEVRELQRTMTELPKPSQRGQLPFEETA